MEKITIGSVVDSKHGRAIITGIEIPEPGQSDGGIEIPFIWEKYKDICVFDLDNGHWAYGDQCEVVKDKALN